MLLGAPLDLVGLLKPIKVLKMLLFQMLRKVKDELIEDLKSIPLQTRLILDHLPKALIRHQQEGRDQEITVQGLMINK